jgi:hypothetical protein
MESFGHTLQACSTYPIVPFLFSFVLYPSRRMIWDRKARMHMIATVKNKNKLFSMFRAAGRLPVNDHSATPRRNLAQTSG